ncbi:MAG TPA: beta-N-acetylhexosaminidase, partial [bacterium]|nr:beta-N-acetylhexosaminidase [bacterium]
FILTLIISTSPLPNGSTLLATLQFDQAKQAFNRQDYFSAERLANIALSNSPDSAAPWLLAGNCFYLQGQDQTALFDYSMALGLDPQIGHLPPFVEKLRQEGPRKQILLCLNPRELAALRQKIGQMIMVSVPGTRLSGQKKMMLNAGWIGGVILFDQNVRTKRQIAAYITQLQKNSPTPLFVAVDQEGGAVRRFKESEGFQRLPSLAALGKTKNPDLAYRFGLLSGQQLKVVGANLNLAPVVDIDRGLPDSIISKYHRSLGSDPQLVSTMAVQIVKGMRAKNIIATAKHFPTETEASANPHKGVAVTDVPLGELESLDLVPYRDLIQNNLLDAVMLSHVVYKSVDPYFPASLSPEMIQKILRGELGYKGLVISDDLRMDAIKQRYPLDVSVVQAVNAGVDVLLVTDNYERRVMDSLVRAVVSGQVPLRSIDEAYGRIMATKAKYGILKGKKIRVLPALAQEPQAANSSPQVAKVKPQTPIQVAQKR